MSAIQKRRAATVALVSLIAAPAVARAAAGGLRDRAAALTLLSILAGRAQASPLVEVYKSPTCGCCKEWIKHLQANGFAVKATDVVDSRFYRARFGMPEKYGSCHTGLVGGYVIEGHVPAREIRRLLKEKPAALGLSVPGMPIGSPGMDTPSYGGHVDPYDVLLVQADGRAAVFASYEPPARR